MHALAQLLVDNGDPCNTRYNILTDEEIEEILESIAAIAMIVEMAIQYENRPG